MKRKIDIRLCIMWAITCQIVLICSATRGANNLNLDSILDAARKQVYHDPHITISTARSVYENPRADLGQRVQALSTISVGYSALRNYERSLEFALSADSLATFSNDPYLRGRTLNTIGSRYQNLQVFNRSVQFLDSALNYIQRIAPGGQKNELLGYNYGIRGFIYREQMSCEVALDYFDKSKYYYEQLENAWLRNSSLSIIIYNKANCLLNLGKATEARRAFDQSIDLARETDARSLEAFAMKGIARVETYEGNFSEAIAILLSAIEVAGDSGDRELFEGLYQELAVNYEAAGDWENYGIYREKYLQEHREIDESVRTSINESLKSNLELIDRSTEESIRSAYWVSMALWLTLVVLLIVGFFDFRRYKSQKRAMKREINAFKNRIRYE